MGLRERLGKEWLFCDGGTGTMLQEMGTVGVGMLLILVAAWFGGLFIARWLRNRKKKPALEEK